MSADSDEVGRLRARVEQLERDNARLRAGLFEPSPERVVQAPDGVQPLFDQAARTIHDYFRRLAVDPARALIGVDDERYLLVRASAFSIDFLDTLVQLYADRGQREALAIPGPMLLPSTRSSGKPWGKVAQYNATAAVLAEAGLADVTGGSFRLRHTFALRQLRRGTAEHEVARWLGVSDPAVMARYRGVLAAPR